MDLRCAALPVPPVENLEEFNQGGNLGVVNVRTRTGNEARRFAPGSGALPRTPPSFRLRRFWLNWKEASFRGTEGENKSGRASRWLSASRWWRCRPPQPRIGLGNRWPGFWTDRTPLTHIFAFHSSRVELQDSSAANILLINPNSPVIWREFWMRRKKEIPKQDSTQEAHSRQKFDAPRSIRALNKRISKLEREVEVRLSKIERALRWDADFLLDDYDQLPSKNARKRPGPRPRSGAFLLSERDQLVQMLESYWPEIEPLCWPRPNLEALKKVLGCIGKGEQDRSPSMRRHLWAARHLLKHLPDAMTFLSGNRFRRDPRQIANAFAGFPSISTWRSLKLCQTKPCNDHIGPRAIKAYIRRKHPELYGNLLAEESLVNFVNAIRRYRSKDTNLAAFDPQYLLDCWQKCVPDPQLLARLLHSTQ